MEDEECLIGWNGRDLISWTGACRFCQGCIGFMLWFCLHPSVDAWSLDCEKCREVLDVCRAPVWRLDP